MERPPKPAYRTTPDETEIAARGCLGGRLFTRAARIKPPDGQRFLMLKPNEQQAPSVTQIHVVLNWFEELKRRVPVKQ